MTAATTMQAYRTAQLQATRRRFQAALAEIIDGIKEVKRGATTSTTLTDKTAFIRKLKGD